MGQGGGKALSKRRPGPDGHCRVRTGAGRALGHTNALAITEAAVRGGRARGPVGLLGHRLRERPLGRRLTRPRTRAVMALAVLIRCAQRQSSVMQSCGGGGGGQGMGVISTMPTHMHTPTYRGVGGLYKLEFLHFKFCTNILYAICSVFLRICAGNNSKRPLFLMSNYWEPYVICSLIFKKWHRFCRARICRFIFSPARNTPPPPPGTWP